jgi:hypothetical protein
LLEEVNYLPLFTPVETRITLTFALKLTPMVKLTEATMVMAVDSLLTINLLSKTLYSSTEEQD